MLIGSPVDFHRAIDVGSSLYDLRPYKPDPQNSSIPAQGAVKLAVLLFYRRILQGSPRRIFRYCNSALMAFVTLYTIASIPLLILVCRPTEAFWMYTSLSPIYKKKYQCFSLRNALIHPAVMSLVSDILITILPMFFLYDLQLPRRQKYALAVLFGLGFM
jgi:hypothetical protein